MMSNPKEWLEVWCVFFLIFIENVAIVLFLFYGGFFFGWEGLRHEGS